MIIFNADDFGLCTSVNEGIIEAYQNGVVRSTTLMANGLAFDHAIDLAKQFPNLDVGIHLVLSTLHSLTNNKTLSDENSQFHKLNYYLENTIDIKEVELEFDAQIQKCIASGISFTHIDGHHHLYAMLPEVLVVVERLANKYGLKIRNYHNRQCNEIYPFSFSDAFYNVDSVEGLIAILQDDCEFMCHPSYVDAQLKTLSSYAEIRKKELEILCSQELKNFLQKEKIELGSYRG